MRKLSDTFVFQESNKKLKILDEIKNVNFATDEVPYTRLEEPLNIINRRFNYGLKFPIYEYIEAGNIRFIYPERANISKLLPVYLANVDGKPTAVVNLRNYAFYDKNENLNIDPRTLFALMQSGFLNLKLNSEWNKISMNTTILRNTTAMYVRLFNKILDKMFGLNLNTIKCDKVNYLIGKFFLIYIMGKEDNDVTSNLALSAIFNKTEPNIVKSIENDTTMVDVYSSFQMLIVLLSKQEGMSKLTIRNFWENWFVMYGESTAFAMEFLPSLYEATFAAMVSARINKDSVFENLVGREMSAIYSEFTRILR
jgi:hypothetical protein